MGLRSPANLVSSAGVGPGVPTGIDAAIGGQRGAMDAEQGTGNNYDGGELYRALSRRIENLPTGRIGFFLVRWSILTPLCCRSQICARPSVSG